MFCFILSVDVIQIDLGGADPQILVDLLAVVREVAAEVNGTHGAARVLTNVGAYQDSKHLHFHVNSGDPHEVVPSGGAPA